jgi:hypothetical protein
VNDAEAMHTSNDPGCFVKIIDAFWPPYLHRNAIYIRSIKGALVGANKPRYTVEFLEYGKRTRLAGEQAPGDPAERNGCATRVPAYQRASFRVNQRYPPE